MEMDSGAVTSTMWLAASILVAAYALIFTEVIHRTLAAVIGAVAMVLVGMIGGFYSEAAAVAAIDANTMFLLMGMMTLVVLLKPTGGFEYLAIRLAKLAKGSPVRLLIYLSTAVTIISLFLDNVTTVLVFAPLTVVIARLLGINPVPYLMAEALLSDTGGVATLVGDPPNVMIGSAAGIDFNRFLFHMGPIILVAWAATLCLLLFLFRKELAHKIDEVLDLDESKVLKDLRGLFAVCFAIAVVIILFFIHHRFHLFPGYVAWIGVAVALALVRPDPDEFLREIDWSVLLFFAGLFIIANFTASVTTRLTLQQIQGAINGPQDLPGKIVVTVAGSTADEWLTDQQISHRTVANVEDAYAQLDVGNVHAVVYDYPVLRYYALTHGNGRVHVVGAPFNEEDYGIAFGSGSPLREEINRALLQLREDGTYDSLYARWFGDE